MNHATIPAPPDPIEQIKQGGTQCLIAVVQGCLLFGLSPEEIWLTVDEEIRKHREEKP
jgi:hypothetical protein